MPQLGTREVTVQIEISGPLQHKIQTSSNHWPAYFPRELSLLPNADARIERILEAAYDLLELHRNHWVREQHLQFRKSYWHSPAADCSFQFKLAIAPKRTPGQYTVMDVSEFFRQSSAGGEE